jgi:hypothetical protein
MTQRPVDWWPVYAGQRRRPTGGSPVAIGQDLAGARVSPVSCMINDGI